MPRPLWTGAISFGLVTIPIRVVSATEDHGIHFRQVHLEDMGRVRTRKVCEVDGEEVPQDEIAKGYEVARDHTVPVTDEELGRMPLPTAKAIEIVAFVDAGTIDPVRIGDSYFLAADGEVANKPYTLLRKALERSDKAAVAKFAWHNRERLGLLRVREGAIVLHSMRWPDEIRSPQELAPKAIELDDGEIERAVELTETMALDGIDGFRDEYRAALEELIAAKAEGREPAAPSGEGEREPGQVVDLMAALNASVKAAQEGRGEHEGEGGATVHEMPAGGGRKGAAKKGAAKGTAAKQGAARKSPVAKGTTKKAPAPKAPARKRSAS